MIRPDLIDVVPAEVVDHLSTALPGIAVSVTRMPGGLLIESTTHTVQQLEAALATFVPTSRGVPDWRPAIPPNVRANLAELRELKDKPNGEWVEVDQTRAIKSLIKVLFYVERQLEDE